MHQDEKIKGKRPMPTFQLIIQLFDSQSTSRLSPFLLSIIPCFISLPQLTPTPFRDREMTGDESDLIAHGLEKPVSHMTLKHGKICPAMMKFYLCVKPYKPDWLILPELILVSVA